MSGTIITVAQQKGGAGKTTLVAHLAVSLMQRGLSVALVDIDPQASLSYWYDARQESFGDEETGLTHSKISGWRTQREVEELAASHDVVLIDSAPHAEMETKTAIRAASLVVIPVQPSPMDFWATQPTLDLAKSEKVTPMLALNRVPPRASLTEQMIERLGDYDVGLAKSSIGNRVAFADSMVSGLTALETKPSSTAATEIRALAKELLGKV